MRFSNHRYYLTHSTHSNRHLQEAWKKYGGDNFKFEILEICTIEELDCKEDDWVERYDSYISGYNATAGGKYKTGLAVSEYIKTAKFECQLCGKELTAGSRKYCLEHKYKCSTCGERTSGRVRCKNCYLKSYNKKLLTFKPHITNCIICGEQLHKTSNNQKMCPGCAKERKKRRRRSVSKLD